MIFFLKEKIATIRSECPPCPATQLTNSSTPTWVISIFPPATNSGKPYPPMLQISVPPKSSETQLYPRALVIFLSTKSSSLPNPRNGISISHLIFPSLHSYFIQIPPYHFFVLSQICYNNFLYRLFWFPLHIFTSTRLHMFSAPNTMEIYFTRSSSDLHFTTSH